MPTRKIKTVTVTGQQLEHKIPSTTANVRGRPRKDTAPACSNTKVQKKKQPGTIKTLLKTITENDKNTNISGKKETCVCKKNEKETTVAQQSSDLSTPQATSEDQPVAANASNNSQSGQSPQKQSQQRQLHELQQQVPGNNHVVSVANQDRIMHLNFNRDGSNNSSGGILMRKQKNYRPRINQYEPYWIQLQKQKKEIDNLRNQVNQLEKVCKFSI